MKDVVEEKHKTAAEVVDITPQPEEGIRKLFRRDLARVLPARDWSLSQAALQ